MMDGGNLWDLQKILGHSDIKTTEEYYAHFSREHVFRRANVISFGNNLVQVDFQSAGSDLSPSKLHPTLSIIYKPLMSLECHETTLLGWCRRVIFILS